MAHVVEVEYDLKEVAGGLALSLPGPAPRSTGLHVSGIIRDIDNRLIHRGERQLDAELSPDELRRMGNYRDMGFMWEQVFTEVFAQRERLKLDGIHQQEMERDGIYGTPDWIAIDPWRVVDFKCTWRSSRRVPNIQEDFRTWFMQLKAYCYMVKTAHAELIVFFVNGDYLQSGPQRRRFQITFGMRELVDNWELLKRHGGKM